MLDEQQDGSINNELLADFAQHQAQNQGEIVEHDENDVDATSHE